MRLPLRVAIALRPECPGKKPPPLALGPGFNAGHSAAALLDQALFRLFWGLGF